MRQDFRLSIEPGQVIADRYRIDGPIERGAMGAVWRATHVGLESPIAIKFLNPAIADDPEMLQRFMREARSAALVRSTHVVQVFDYGVERGVPYIAMELLVGESLDRRLDQRGVLAPAELDRVFTEVARAVGVAHEVGVIHRDLKPGNVFITREAGQEVTKVLDFGIAKWLDQRLAEPPGAGTHSGVTLGTPHYMSPEQARGDRNLDHRTDLWSLAVVAFECLTGQLPFRAEALGEMMVNICTKEPLLPSSLAVVPAGFDAWFLKGVMKDPPARFQSASEMASALHSILSPEAASLARSSGSEPGFWRGPESGAASTPEAAERTQPRSRAAPQRQPFSARRRAKIVVSALSVAAVGLALWSFWGGGAPRASVRELAAPEVNALSAPVPSVGNAAVQRDEAQREAEQHREQQAQALRVEGGPEIVEAPAPPAVAPSPDVAEAEAPSEPRASPPPRSRRQAQAAKRRGSKKKPSPHKPSEAPAAVADHGAPPADPNAPTEPAPPRADPFAERL